MVLCTILLLDKVQLEILRRNGPIFQDGNVQRRGVKKIYGDGEIDGAANIPDMVVIEFDEPFDLDPGVIEPACLPTQEITIGSSCYTSGWGQLGEELGTSFALKALSVEVIDIQGFMKEITETL